MTLTYDISELIPYINWPYFFFAWQVKESSEKDRLRQEAEALLQQLEGKYHAYGLFELFDAHSDGDDFVVFRGRRKEEGGRRKEITSRTENSLPASAARKSSLSMSLRFHFSS